MSRREFENVQKGDRVRYSLYKPRGAKLVGLVTWAGKDYCGHFGISVKWDGQRGYNQFSLFRHNDAQLRRLEKMS